MALDARMTDDRPAIARAVAKALCAEPMIQVAYYDGWCWQTKEPPYDVLFNDGSNLFTPSWIWRCVEWLREQDIVLIFPGKYDTVCEAYSASTYPADEGYFSFMFTGHIAEFPARAVAALAEKGAEGE